MGLYAQHLGAHQQNPYANEDEYRTAITRAAELINQAKSSNTC